jgi:transposase
MHISSVGIDLGKTTFHLVALGEQGKVLVRKKFSRKQLLIYTARLQPALIGIEACSGAHFIGAALRDQGHQVRLIPAQFVKPCLKSNKNDFLDAEAIAEAVARKNMRFVPIKTGEELDLQALHRVRDRLMHRRTAVINQIRGFLWSVASPWQKGGEWLLSGRVITRGRVAHIPPGTKKGSYVLDAAKRSRTIGNVTPVCALPLGEVAIRSYTLTTFASNL